MGKPFLSCLVKIAVTFTVYESCVACSDGFNDNVEGILGGNINLTCITMLRCDSIIWDRPTIDEVLSLPGETVQVGFSKSHLPISGISVDDDGLYRCYCYANNVGYDICNVHLKTICQATVILNGRMNFYNSASRTNYVNVTVGTRIKITCPEGGRSDSDCRNVRRKEFGKFTYTFNVSPAHDSCHIECRLGNQDGYSCDVWLTFNVTMLENTQTSTSFFRSPTVSSQPSGSKGTFTHTTVDRSITTTVYTTVTVKQTEEDSKSGSFPLIVPILILIVLLGIVFFVCSFIFHSKRKSASLSNKNVIFESVMSSVDSNIPIGPTYESAIVSFEGYEMAQTKSMQSRVSCSNDTYDEVACPSNSSDNDYEIPLGQIIKGIRQAYVKKFVSNTNDAGNFQGSRTCGSYEEIMEKSDDCYENPQKRPITYKGNQ